MINISSEAGRMPLPTGSVYSATKAALDAITISLSKEFSGKNIHSVQSFKLKSLMLISPDF